MNTKNRGQSSKWFWPVLFFILLMAAAVLSYQFRDYFEPKVIASLQYDPTCNLRQSACRLTLPDGGEVEFSITPDTIPVLQPVQFHVAVSGTNVSAVEVDLVGTNMNMGYNRPALKSKGNNTFSGETVIPVCVRNRMDWEARVLLHTPRGIVMAPFRFYTLKK
jgi:hypothetical protein